MDANVAGQSPGERVRAGSSVDAGTTSPELSWHDQERELRYDLTKVSLRVAALWEDDLLRDVARPVDVARALGVLRQLLALTSEEHLASSRISALATIDRIVSQPSHLTLPVASSLAPHYPIAVLCRGPFHQESRPLSCSEHHGGGPHRLQLDSGLNDLLRAGMNVAENSHRDVPLGDRLISIIAGARTEAVAAHSGSKPLGIALADALTEGCSPAIRASKELMRAGFFGEETEIFNAIAGGQQKLKFVTIFDSLQRLEDTFRSFPPLTNPDINKLLMAAALFASEDGAVAQSSGLHEVANYMGISNELRPFFEYIPAAVLKGATVAKSEDLAHGLCALCRKFVDQYDISCCEVSDLAFGLAIYVRAFNPLRESCNGLIGHVRRFVGYEWKSIELSRTATLVNERDLTDLGVTTGADILLEAPRIIAGISSLRLVDGVRNRRTALEMAALQPPAASVRGAVVEAPESTAVAASSFDDLEVRTGGTLSQFHPTREVSKVRMGRSLVRYFENDGPTRRQFRAAATSQEIMDEHLTTGNYPEIRRHFEHIGLRESAVVELVQSGNVRSLVELTYLCREFEWKQRNFDGFALGIDNLTSCVGVQRSYARVERSMPESVGRDIRTVLMAVGYQGKAEQSGYGMEHIRAARGADQRKLEKVLRCSGADRGSLERLLLDGVLYVSATSECIIPSGIRPRTHSLMIGRVRDTDDTYLTVVVARLPDYEKEYESSRAIITTIVHGSAGQMRGYVRGQLHKLLKNTGDLQLVERSCAGCSGLLEAAGQHTITVPELSNLESHRGLAQSNCAEIYGVQDVTLVPSQLESVPRGMVGTPAQPLLRRVAVSRRIRSSHHEDGHIVGAVSGASGQSGTELPRRTIGRTRRGSPSLVSHPESPTTLSGEEFARVNRSLAWAPVFATELLKDAHT